MKTVRPTILFASLLLLGWLGIAVFPSVPDRLGLATLGHWFLDTRAILAAFEAMRAGLDPYAQNSFDPLGRPHVYSDVWLWFEFLGLGNRHTFVAGLVLVGGFLVVTLATVRPRNGWEAFGAGLIGISPPVLLAVNRANNDLAIFVLVAGALLLWRDGRGLIVMVAWLAIATFATGLKYYPAAMLASLVLWRPARAGWVGIATGVAALFGVWLLVRDDIGRASLVDPAGVHAYGGAVWLKLFGLDSRGMRLLLALGVVLAGAGLAWRRRWTSRFLLSDSSTPAAVTGAGLLVLCFVLGSSYAYRWVFALWLALPLWREARGMFWLLVAALWADGLFCLAANVGLATSETFASLERWFLAAMQPVVWAIVAWLIAELICASVASVRAAWSTPATRGIENRVGPILR